jgi:hypothetical protein
MEIHSIDGYGTDAYVYLQVNRKEKFRSFVFYYYYYFRLLKNKQVNGYRYAIVQLMNITSLVDTNQIGQKRNKICDCLDLLFFFEILN